MKTFVPLVVAAAAVLLPASLQAKIERTVEKSFTVSPGGKLSVDTQGGEIRVVTGGDSQVKVIAREKFRTDSESEADDVQKKLSLRIEQSGNDVSAISKYEGPREGKFWGSWPPVQVEFEVTVPARYSVDLRTSGGGIKVSDLQGSVHANTSGGAISLGAIDGPVDIRTSGGSINVKSASQTLKANTSGGPIEVGSAKGEARLSTSGGRIRIDSAAGAL